jgi:glycosyltransferase involved in cell wall biosynthesis
MAREPRARLVRLDANTGLTAAFDAGYAASRGRIVVTLDADLQNDPRDIPRLLEALEDADAAVGWRRARHDSWLKRVSSRIGNGVRNRISGDHVRDSACSLRAMRRECLGALPPYNGLHRFVPTLLRTAGFRVVEVPVQHRPRRFGRSKYGVRNRAARGLVDLLAVTWMMRRALHYQAREIEAGTTAGRWSR